MSFPDQSTVVCMLWALVCSITMQKLPYWVMIAVVTVGAVVISYAMKG